MTVQNIDPDLLETFTKLGDAVTGLTNRMSRSYDPVLEAQRRSLQADKEYKDRQDKIRADQLAASRVFIGATLGFARELSASAGSFKPLNSVIDATTKVMGSLVEKIPIFGGLIRGAVEGTAEGLKFIVDQFDTNYKIFEDLSSTGVVSTFNDLTRAVKDTGLNFNDFSTVFGKNSKEIARFGGSALEGSKKFTAIAEASILARDEFQRLGISASEYREIQAFYIDEEKRFGRTRTLNAQQLAEGSNKFVLELDKMTKLFGVSRKEQLDQRKILQTDIQYRAAASKLGKGFTDAIATMTTGMSNIPGGDHLAKTLRGLLAGLVPVTEEQKALTLALSQAGINVVELGEQFRAAGSQGGINLLNTLAKAGPSISKSFSDLAMVRPDLPILQFLTQFKDLTERGEITEQALADLAKTQTTTKDTTEDMNSKLADTRVKLYNASTQIQLLAVETDIAASAMSLMSGAIHKAVELVYKLTGREPPKSLSHQSKIGEALEEVQRAQRRLNDLMENSDRSLEEFTKLQRSNPLLTPDAQTRKIQEEKTRLDNLIKKAQNDLDTSKKALTQAQQNFKEYINKKSVSEHDKNNTASNTAIANNTAAVNVTLNQLKNNENELKNLILDAKGNKKFIDEYKAASESPRGLVHNPLLTLENKNRYDRLLKARDRDAIHLTELQIRLADVQTQIKNINKSTVSDNKFNDTHATRKMLTRQQQAQVNLEIFQKELAARIKELDSWTEAKTIANENKDNDSLDNINRRIIEKQEDIRTLSAEIKRLNLIIKSPDPGSASPSTTTPSTISQVQLDNTSIGNLATLFKESLKQGTDSTITQFAELKQAVANLGSILESIDSGISKTNQIYARISSQTLA